MSAMSLGRFAMIVLTEQGKSCQTLMLIFRKKKGYIVLSKLVIFRDIGLLGMIFRRLYSQLNHHVSQSIPLLVSEIKIF